MTWRLGRGGIVEDRSVELGSLSEVDLDASTASNGGGTIDVEGGEGGRGGLMSAEKGEGEASIRGPESPAPPRGGCGTRLPPVCIARNIRRGSRDVDMVVRGGFNGVICVWKSTIFIKIPTFWEKIEINGSFLIIH